MFMFFINFYKKIVGIFTIWVVQLDVKYSGNQRVAMVSKIVLSIKNVKKCVRSLF